VLESLLAQGYLAVGGVAEQGSGMEEAAARAGD